MSARSARRGARRPGSWRVAGQGRHASLRPAWQAWLIENYVLGTPVHLLEERLVSSGVPAAAAEALVEAEVSDPYVVGSRRAASMCAKLESLLDTYGELHRQSGAHQQVECRRAPSVEEFLERYYLQNRPLRVEGAMDEWPALRRWSPERFFPPRARSARARELGRQRLQPLLGDILPPRYTAPRVGPPAVWLCPPGATLSLRRGLRSVLLCQVLGATRVRLLPSFWLHRACEGPVDPRAVEPDSPRLPRVRLLTCELRPGEMLLLPVGWWHELRASEPGVCVSFESFAAPKPNVRWR